MPTLLHIARAALGLLLLALPALAIAQPVDRLSEIRARGTLERDPLTLKRILRA